MCIRQATNNDHNFIRKLPVQLTARPVTSILPKHYRVLFQEPAVRLLVFEGTHAINAFIAVRLLPAAESNVRFLSIVHLGLERQAYKAGIADDLEAYACLIARQQLCAAVLVQAEKLQDKVLDFYKGRGYRLESEILIKRLA